MAIAASGKTRYKAIFFDLDHTLWDFDSNSKETLSDLFDKYLLGSVQAGFDEFMRLFKKVNDDLWDLYNKGKIDKEVIRESRFVEILNRLGCGDNEMARTISTEYLFTCPRKTKLMPNAINILDYLAPHYDMHVLTNGFEDVQAIKMEGSGIHHYFKSVITSETAGHKKPALEFFHHALESTNLNAKEAIMIGDNLKTDIGGAVNASIDAVYYNPSGNGRPHRALHEIDDLQQLIHYL